MTVKPGKFVAEFINDGDLDDIQVQPNGVDLRIGKILTPEGYDQSGYLTDEDNEKWMDYWQEMEPKEVEFPDGEIREAYILEPNKSYKVVYNEIINIPGNCIGYVYPRSTFMRMGGVVNTAVWDNGYRGIGEGRISTDYTITVETNARIAQIVFHEAEETEDEYEGSYQEERLDDEA